MSNTRIPLNKQKKAVPAIPKFLSSVGNTVHSKLDEYPRVHHQTKHTNVIQSIKLCALSRFIVITKRLIRSSPLLG